MGVLSAAEKIPTLVLAEFQESLGVRPSAPLYVQEGKPVPDAGGDFLDRGSTPLTSTNISS